MAKTLIVELGNTVKLPLKGNEVWVEKKPVIKAIPKGKLIYFQGKSSGSSYVRIAEELFKIEVIKPQELPLFKKIHSEISKKLGLEVVVENSKIVIKGRLYKLKDWIDINQHMEDGDSYVFKAKLSEEINNEAQIFFNQLFKDQGLPEQNLLFSASSQLRLPTNDPYFDQYESILNKFGLQISKDKLSINLAPVVKVQITVAEVNRGFSQNYGIKVPNAFQTQVLPEFKLQDFDTQIHMMETSGKGKILASPNLICRSGKEAEFLAGGEFPIKVRNRLSNDVVWKKYGILLKVKPEADSMGRMSISLHTEVSSIDKSLSVDGIPAISTNKVSSHFDMTSSKTIVLSGLLKDIQGESYEGIPGLSRLPIIGSLFSSRDFLEKKTELLVFVRPSIQNFHETYPRTELHHLGIDNESRY